MKLTLLAPSFSVIQVKSIDPSILKIVPLFLPIRQKNFLWCYQLQTFQLKR